MSSSTTKTPTIDFSKFWDKQGTDNKLAAAGKILNFPNHDSKYSKADVTQLVLAFLADLVKAEIPDEFTNLKILKREAKTSATIMVEKGIHQRNTDPHVDISIPPQGRSPIRPLYHIDLTENSAAPLHWKAYAVSYKKGGVEERWSLGIAPAFANMTDSKGGRKSISLSAPAANVQPVTITAANTISMQIPGSSALFNPPNPTASSSSSAVPSTTSTSSGKTT